MTSIVTKSGSVIVKGGSVGTDCGCCGGWYCCKSNDCSARSISYVEVTISAQDYIRWAELHAYPPSFGYFSSIGFLGSLYSGSHSLTQTGTHRWEKTFPAEPGNSCGGTLVFGASSAQWILDFRWSTLSYTVTADGRQPVYKELVEMNCPAGLVITPARMSGAILCGEFQGTDAILSGDAFNGVSANSNQTVVRESGSYAFTMTISSLVFS